MIDYLLDSVYLFLVKSFSWFFNETSGQFKCLDSHTHTHTHTHTHNVGWPEKNWHPSVLCRHWLPSRGLIKSDGDRDRWQEWKELILAASFMMIDLK